MVDFSPAISAADFDELASNALRADPRIQAVTVAIARAVLVDRRGLSEVAQEHGVTKQRVSAIRKRFYADFLESRMYPRDWVQATVTAPKDKLETFLAEIEQFRVDYFSKK